MGQRFLKWGAHEKKTNTTLITIETQKKKKTGKASRALHGAMARGNLTQADHALAIEAKVLSQSRSPP